MNAKPTELIKEKRRERHDEVRQAFKIFDTAKSLIDRESLSFNESILLDMILALGKVLRVVVRNK